MKVKLRFIAIILSLHIGLFIIRQNYHQQKATSNAHQLERSVYIVEDDFSATPADWPVQSSPSPPIRILSWTTSPKRQNDWWSVGSDLFSECDNLTPDMRCSYSSDRSHYNTSDAVLFRMRALELQPELPLHRYPSQKWIFYEHEPPTKTWGYLQPMDKNLFRGLFNLTSTIAQDSNITTKHQLRCRRDLARYEQLEGVDFARGKTKGVVWFVSHCNTTSKREQYVRELTKYIGVDIFGECGPLKCGSFNEPGSCYRDLVNTTYKFHISFENSLCDGYVTEKIERLITPRVINVIPVVMGFENYTNMLPDDSFIDVRDFASPKHLAKYLKSISENDVLFNQYIRSLNSLKCIRPVPYPCRLCKYLHTHRSEREKVKDVVEYWSVHNKCVDLDQFWDRKSNTASTSKLVQT